MKKLWLGVATLAAIGCGGGGGTDSGTPGTDSGPPPTCPAYCTQIAAACTGANQQYGTGTSDFCAATCGTYTVGTGASDTGNTLSCRAYHLSVAAMPGMADAHCPHAGPAGFAGGGGCGGSACANFCALVASACTGAAGTMSANPYADTAACMTACAAFPDLATVPYNANATGGNSLACRLYHATAAVGDPMVHCGHTAAVSATCN
jgi:hypothetical protein